jgi:hypothetical protein
MIRKGEDCRAAVLQVQKRQNNSGMAKYPIFIEILITVDIILGCEKVSFVRLPNGAFYGVFRLTLFSPPP